MKKLNAVELEIIVGGLSSPFTARPMNRPNPMNHATAEQPAAGEKSNPAACEQSYAAGFFSSQDLICGITPYYTDHTGVPTSMRLPSGS